MAAYFVIDLTVTDPEKIAEYARRAEPIVTQYGGRFLVRGGEAAVIEGEWRPDLFVLIEFPDIAAIRRFHGSEEFRPLKPLRWEGAITNIAAAVEGIAAF